MSQPSPADINPYASPSASANLPFEPERPRFRILAVVVGCLVDIVASSVAGILFGIALAIVLMMQGTRVEQMQQALTNSTTAVLGQLLIGSSGSILGGYVAAWMARQRELQHALATGIASLVIGIVMLSLASLSPIPITTQPTWYAVVAFILTIPATLLGGWLRQSVARRDRR